MGFCAADKDAQEFAIVRTWGAAVLRPYMVFALITHFSRGFEGVAYFWKQAEEKYPRKFST
jgi:hypothetical protein